MLCSIIIILTSVYREKKNIPMIALQIQVKIKVFLSLLCGVHHSVIMANFMMPETLQPIIVIILIIYSVYLLKNLVELKEYISGRIASYLFQFLRKLHSFLSAGL